MDFELTVEQKMIRDEVRTFALKEIIPRAEEMERTGAYPYDIIEKIGNLGFMGIPFSDRYGGTGGTWVEMHLCIEETPVCRYYRGAKLLQIVEGTSEIQRTIIGRILSKLH